MVEQAGDETMRPWPWAIRWLVIATVLAAFTQVTLSHWALRAAGVRLGKADAVVAPETGPGAVVKDARGVYYDDELVGTRIWFGDADFAVVGNQRQTILVEGEPDAVRAAWEAHPEYVTGIAARAGLARLALAVPGFNFTIADALLGVLLAALVGYLALARRRPCLALPPGAILLFLAVAALSLLGLGLGDGGKPDRGAGLRELVQYAEVFLVGFVVFREVLRSPALRRQVALCLIVGAGLLIVAALWEYAQILRGHTLRGLHDIGELDSLLGFRYNPGYSGQAGSEGSKNLLAAYLLVFVPLLLALSQLPEARYQRWGLMLLAVLGFVCILQPILLFCTLIGAIVVGLQWRRRWAVPGIVAGAFAVQLLACLLIPHHGRILLDSVALTRYSDTYGLLPMPVKGMQAIPERLMQGHAPHPDRLVFQQKYLEMQAALNGFAEAPLLGHGIGSYQARIGGFYNADWFSSLRVFKAPVNLMEQDAHGLYFVHLVEIGGLGLVALVGLLASFARRSLGGEPGIRTRHDRAMLTGIVGMLAAILLGGWFVSWLVRGLSLLVVLLLAWPVAVELNPGEEEEP